MSESIKGHICCPAYSSCSKLFGGYNAHVYFSHSSFYSVHLAYTYCGNMFHRYLSLVGVLFVPNIFGRNSTGSITDPTERSISALHGLAQWYNTSTGIWESTGWWNSANIMTTIGDLALAEPHNIRLQILARRTFANALRRAPAKNPDPPERPTGNETSPSPKSSKFGTPYTKWFDPTTFQPHTTYPSDWLHRMAHHIDNTDQFTTDPTFDESTLLANLHPDPYQWVNKYNDDNLWWALAWITAYDVTHYAPYLTLAEGIFAIVSQGWNTTCYSGGVYWNADRTYINAITNELFFSTAAHLANRCAQASDYADWATRSLTWFLRTGMLNEKGTINDGLDSACVNNQGEVWSYNQGVILGGLVQLNLVDRNASYIELATHIARAALAYLADDDGVIHDACEATDGGCGGDGTQFKGVFMRNLAELNRESGGFEDALRVNAESIWTRDREKGEEGNVFGVDWAGPFDGMADASLQGSAMDGLVAAIGIDGY
jgi:predicted alpha-1,6-mannanase (GH76 family)